MPFDLIAAILFMIPAMLSKEIPITRAGYSDTPAITCLAEGGIWIAWQSLDPASEGTTLWASRYRDGIASELLPITHTSGDILGPRIATAADGTLWIVWSESREGARDIHVRSLPDGKPGDPTRLTDDGQSFRPVIAADDEGKIWIAWQSRRDGHFGIFARCFSGDTWADPVRISKNRSANRSPAIAIDAQGRAWVAWDTFRNGNYDIYLRHTSEGSDGWADPIRVTASMRHDMTPSVAANRDGIWIAWVRSPRWGAQHYRLNMDKRLMLRRYLPTTGQFMQPQADRRDLDGSVPIPVDPRGRVVPLTPYVVAGADGSAHLFYRQFRDQGSNDWGWHVDCVNYAGERWSDVTRVSDEPGFPVSEIAATHDPSGRLWVAYQACGYAGGRKGVDDATSNIHLRAVSPGPQKAPVLSSAVLPAPKHLESFEVTRPTPAERPSLSANGKRYQLLWGDLHRHTTLSKCVPERDGTLWDHYRWAQDVAMLDFYATTDHTEQTSELEARKARMWADLFHAEPDFVTLYGCEQNFRDTEHTNFFYINRALGGIVREARAAGSELADAIRRLDERGLHGKVLIARHFHGDGFGAKYETAPPFHPDYERVMEAVQTRGFSPVTVEHYLSQGARAGLIGGSDHARFPGGPGGPWIYPYALTGVWAAEASREGVWEALTQRRSLATNGKKIRVDFRSDGHLMGEAYGTNRPPSLEIHATATTRVWKLELLRNGEVILAKSDMGKSVELTHQEEALPPGEYYYYVRVTQTREGEDNYRGMAITSPIWVTVD